MPSVQWALAQCLCRRYSVGVFLTIQGNAELNRLNHLKYAPLEAEMCFKRIENSSLFKCPEALHTCTTNRCPTPTRSTRL
jgi:hypothetical protein